MQDEIRWLLQEKYGGRLTAAAKEDIERLKAGEPLGYVIGFTEFLGCKIDLSKKPLIPRVETEFWVEQVVQELKAKSYKLKAINVLDMFAGSGAIGIAIMRHLPGAQVTFVDSEENCIEQIPINCKLNNIPEERYDIVQSDIFENPGEAIRQKLKHFDGPVKIPAKRGLVGFDYIFANPPYIPKIQDSRFKIQESVLKYEPHKALFGGDDGMDIIRHFLATAKNCLAKNGNIYMEFDPPQKNNIKKLAKEYGYGACEFHRDQFHKWRYVVIS